MGCAHSALQSADDKCVAGVSARNPRQLAGLTTRLRQRPARSLPTGGGNPATSFHSWTRRTPHNNLPFGANALLHLLSFATDLVESPRMEACLARCCTKARL